MQQTWRSGGGDREVGGEDHANVGRSRWVSRQCWGCNRPRNREFWSCFVGLVVGLGVSLAVAVVMGVLILWVCYTLTFSSPFGSHESSGKFNINIEKINLRILFPYY